MKLFNKRNVFLISFIAAVIVITGILIVNSMKNSYSPNDPDASEAVDRIHLDVWTFFDINTPDSYYIDLWKEMGEEYNYDIDIQTFSTQQIKDKLRIAAAEKNLPDIFLVWGGTYPDYLFDAGVCVPVQNYLEESDAGFLASYVQPYKDGNNYIIPCLPEAYSVMYVNNHLINEMGLSVPDTWEDLISLIEEVDAYNEKNGTDYAAIELGDRDSWLGELLFDVIVNQTDPDAWEELENGNISFDDELFRETAEKVRNLTDAGAFPDNFVEIGEVEAVERFINGEAVLFPHQSTIIYYLLNNMEEDELSVMQFPSCGSLADHEYYLMDINHTQRPGLCICSYGQHTDEAARLCLDFSERVNTINVANYGYINMTEKEIPIPEDLPEPVLQLRNLLENEKKSTAYPYALLQRENADAFRLITKRFFAGEYSVDIFLKKGGYILKLENFTNIES